MQLTYQILYRSHTSCCKSQTVRALRELLTVSLFAFQAMVHELIGIQDNKVDLKKLGNFPKDQEVGPFVFPVTLFF